MSTTATRPLVSAANAKVPRSLIGPAPLEYVVVLVRYAVAMSQVWLDGKQTVRVGSGSQRTPSGATPVAGLGSGMSRWTMSRSATGAEKTMRSLGENGAHSGRGRWSGNCEA